MCDGDLSTATKIYKNIQTYTKNMQIYIKIYGFMWFHIGYIFIYIYMAVARLFWQGPGRPDCSKT